jgi:hypothetical protein
MGRPRKGSASGRVQKSIKLDPEIVAEIDRIRERDVRDFSQQIEFWIREKIAEHRAQLERRATELGG